MPGTERFPLWLRRGASFVLSCLALAAIAASTGEERFTTTLVLTFAAILALVHAVIFITVRVSDRIGRS